MGILRDFERRLGGAVEGFFARAFRSGLQPVELAKAIQRYAADYQQVGLDGVFVPNVYRFTLSSDDLERFSGFTTALARELAEVVERTVRERNWHLQGPVRIELEAGPSVPVGTYELRGKVESAAPGSPASAPAGGAPVPRAQSSPSQGSVLAPPGRAALVDANGTRFTVSETAVIGRLPDCDVTLDDPSVSRRHAKVQRRHGIWTVADLGSTNGLRVNNRSVEQAELGDGDRLQFGGVKLTFSVEP